MYTQTMSNLIKFSLSEFRINFMVYFRRVLASFVLIGFLFNVFHDFVFYKVDPCADYIISYLSIDKEKSQKDPFCKIHHELHQNYIEPEAFIQIDSAQNEYIFFYQKPHIKPCQTSIFKPPKTA